MSLPSHIHADNHRVSLENPNIHNGSFNGQTQRNFEPTRSQSSASYLDRSVLTERALAMHAGTRSIRDNIQNVFQEIRPIVQTVHSNWLSSHQSEIPGTSINNYESINNTTQNLNESFVINLEQGNNHNHNHSHSHTHSHIRMTENINDETNSVTNGDGTISRGIDADQQANIRSLEIPVNEALRQNPEARAIMQTLLRYLPFSLILLAKCLYDNREIILTLLILFITFIHANKTVIQEASKQQRKSFTKLALETVYIIGSVVLITYLFRGVNLFMNLVFMGSYENVVTVWDLLYLTGIVDITIKLLTVAFKILIISLPGTLLTYQKRGKIFLMIEMTSQLYRALTPIQPWLYYLLEYYQGSEKIMGVLFSAAYMVSKGTDLLQRAKAFKTAILKMLQDVNLGISPTMEQLISAGNQCPICHDEYNTPVLLACRHIFCEPCVTIWFDREQTCPLCRAKVVEDPSFKNGATTYFVQLY